MKHTKAFMQTLCCAALLLAVAAYTAHGQARSPLARPLKFTDEKVTLPLAFQSSRREDPYLARLRAEYALEEVVAGQRSEYEKVRAISRWVRSRWEHNGSNIPEKPDPLSILEEAKQGKRFRCVEYSAVLAGALNAVGIPARVVSLLTEDVETRESGAAHVVAEAYLADRKKWVMVDGQWDVIPTLKGRPLCARR